MQSFTLKGSLFPSSVLRLKSSDLQLIAEQIHQKIAQAPQFFYMSPVVIDCSELDVKAEINFQELKRICQENQLNLFGVTGLTHSARELVQQAGLSYLSGHQETKTTESTTINTQPVDPQPKEAIQTEVTQVVAQSIPTKFVQQNIRSGQQIYAKDSDLVILGSVSNGAEVVADGNIHIYGTLRGRAIAGAAGAQASKIFCSCLQAELVSIAGNYWLNDQLPAELQRQAVVIQLHDEKLTVNTL